MIHAIRVSGKNSYYDHGLRMLSSEIGSPPRDEHTERVPYSNVTYDFDELFGQPGYGERTLTYVLEFLCSGRAEAQARIVHIRNWLQWTGRKDLYDTDYPDYHFEVRAPSVTISGSHGVYTVTVQFMANPAMLPNTGAAYTADTCHYPDVNGNGEVDAADASLILQAVSDLGAGRDTGLTQAQLLAADADMDGEITAMDAALVLEYISAVGVGQFTDTPENWTAFLNRRLDLRKGVY